MGKGRRGARRGREEPPLNAGSSGAGESAERSAASQARDSANACNSSCDSNGQQRLKQAEDAVAESKVGSKAEPAANSVNCSPAPKAAKQARKASGWPTVRICHQGATRRFLVPQSSSLLKETVCAEFGVHPAAQLILLSPYHAADHKANQEEEVIVPFAVEYLEPDREYFLKVAPPSHSAQRMGTNAGGSHSSSARQRDGQNQQPANSKPNHVVAMYSYEPQSGAELPFHVGEEIHVTSKYNEGWYLGEIHDADGSVRRGYFPSTYVRGLEWVELNETTDPLQDEEYFEGYATLYIHHQMLHDDSRTLAYKNAVASLRPHIEGKTVMDIGCGSGILSLFCAQAGAKRVYAIDASSIIDTAARKVIQENKMENKITLIKGKVEEVSLPVREVDVIISEWMGTFMVCETMIESVLWARQHYLARDGLIMPSRSILYLALVRLDCYYDERVRFWEDVYGVRMGSLVPQAKKTFFEKPIYDRIIEASEVVSDPATILDMDLCTARPEDLESNVTEFTLTAKSSGNVHGFGSWFDTEFAGRDCRTVVLSTSPFDKPTHWKHVMFVLDDPIYLYEGESICGSIAISRNKHWRRHFEATIKFHTSRQPDAETTRLFEMWR